MIETSRLSVTQFCRYRVCGADSRRIYDLLVLGKYEVAYFRCESCQSLQIQTPYWLDESYTHNLAAIDTGAAQRNLSNLAASYLVARIFGMKNVLDFGGGDGLLCRLLRDYRINCFVIDKYAQANYARAFVIPDFARPQIVLAFEVLEHFADPNSDLPELFRLEPEILICSTGVFSGQGADWWYLTPESSHTVLLLQPECAFGATRNSIHSLPDLFRSGVYPSPFPCFKFINAQPSKFSLKNILLNC